MTRGRFRWLGPNIAVAAQLTREDFVDAAAQGFKTVVNNRPDGEAPDQITSEDAREAAANANLQYAHLPVVSGGMTLSDVAAFNELVGNIQGPILAYCRSGTRSCHLWALSAARELEPDEVIERAAAAGYDLSGQRPLLAKIHDDELASGGSQPQ